MALAVPPIRTDAEYESALSRVEVLMNAKRGTPDGDRLDVLVRLLAAYEERQWSFMSSASG